MRCRTWRACATRIEGRMLRGIVGAGLMLLALASDAPAQSRSRASSAAGFSDVSAQRGLYKGGLVPSHYKTDAELGFTRGGGLPTKKTETTTRKRPVSVAVQRIYYQSARPNFNLACKRKYPGFVS